MPYFELHSFINTYYLPLSFTSTLIWDMHFKNHFLYSIMFKKFFFIYKNEDHIIYIFIYLIYLS